MTRWGYHSITRAIPASGFARAPIIVLAALVVLCTSSAALAVINNGENASDILGEYNSSSMADNPGIYTKNCGNDGASPYGFNYPTGGVIDTTLHWLFVADSSNNRVLVFPLTTGNLISSKTPSYVLGQANFTSCSANEGGSTSQSSLFLAVNSLDPDQSGLAVDPTNHYLYVADVGNNRVMVFPTSSMVNGENASYEFGQPSGTAFTSSGHATTLSTLYEPSGVALDTTNHFLYVADFDNNRVLVFATASGGGPSTGANGENATYVLGETSFTVATGGTTQVLLKNPSDVAIDSGNNLLYVADISNNRVMVFNSTATAMANGGSGAGESATYLLGQATGAWTSNGAATTQSGLSSPASVTLDTTYNRLFVSDEGNARMMIFPTSGITSGETASYVLGATNFTTYTNNYETATDDQFQGYNKAPFKSAYDSTNNILYAPDSGSSRVMQFNLTFTVSSTSQGDEDACAINSSGALYCWGLNGYGEDGLGNTTQYETPQQVTSPSTTWSSVSQSYYDACAITTAGKLYCWGYNAWGEDGVGNTTEHTSPQQVTSPSTTWSSVSMGEGDACAITTAGKLYCWGENGDGEDGVGNTTQYETPQQVGTATNWTTVSQSGGTACAINSSGKLYCWGNGGGGSLGLGNTTQYETPQQVGTATTWTAVSANGQDTCGINGGALYCWGYNSHGELGLGNTTEYNTPQQVGTATNWTTVSTNGTDGTGHSLDTCAINSSGALYCWGSNSSGEDGLGNTTQYETPQQVTSPSTTWSSVSQSGVDACAITTAGSLYCWGENGDGEDGVGNGTEYKTPQQVGPINGENAADLLGQYQSPSSTATVNWNAFGANNGPNSLGFERPEGVALDPVHNQLFISDNGELNSRVLVYNLNGDNSISTSSGGHTADYVIGQPSLMGGDGAGYDFDGQLDGPEGLAFDSANNRLFVANTTNNQIMVFGTPITSNGQSGLNELGGPSGDPYDYIAGGCTQSTMNNPQDVAYDSANTRLFVADTGCNRVLVFTVSCTGSPCAGTWNGENASYELGQPSGTAWTTSAAADTQSGMNTPIALAYDRVNQRLFVDDQGNNRVLVFNVAGLSTNGENATAVIGQASFTTKTAAKSQTGLDDPVGLAYDTNNSRLFVANGKGVDILVYNAGPSSLPANNASATFVLGQTAFTGGVAGLTQSALSLDGGNGYAIPMYYDLGSGRLFVPDNQNNRVLIFDCTYGSPNFLLLMPE